MKYSLQGRFVRYIIVGSGVATFYLLTFAMLFTGIGLHHQLSTAISFVLTLLVSYVSQRHFTYTVGDEQKRKNSLLVSSALFVLNTFVIYGIISGIMYVGLDVLNQNAYLVQFSTLAVMAMYNFFFFHVVFK